MPTTAPLAALTPAEIDTAWFPLMAATDRAARAMIAARKNKRTSADRLAQLEALTLDAQADEVPYAHEWTNRNGWTRAWLVPGGHVHTSTACTTCYPTTQFVVIPDLSGLDHDAMVAAIGEDACTICYPGDPDGPRTVFTPDEKRDHAERAAAAAELAEKRRTAATKAITNPDGTELRTIEDDHRTGALSDGRVVKTETAARNEAVSGLASLLWYGESHPTAAAWVAFADRVADALAAKHGTDRDEIRADLDTRAAKKDARDRRAAGVA